MHITAFADSEIIARLRPLFCLPAMNAPAASSPSAASSILSRNLALLVAAQALGGASPPIIISLGGLVGQQLSANPAQATLPVSIYQLGLALSTLPAAWLMQRASRRAAYVLGAVLGIISGLVAAQGIAQSNFALFCTGTALAGFYAACVQSYRFAATDGLQDSALQARAISLVMVGGLVAAIIGPQVVIATRDMLAVRFAGSFYGLTGLAILALPILLLLRLPAVTSKTVTGPARSLREIALTRKFLVAACAGVVSYGLMSFLMTAAPMAMVGHGHSDKHAALGIQWHVLAMFGPSFFTGRLIERFGKRQITALGLAMIGAAAVMALAGLELLHFWGALILLGVGWNFGFIGSTALVTECYRPSEKAKVQALNDFLIFGTVAAASFSSGSLLHTAGWNGINLWIVPIVAVVVLMVMLLVPGQARTASTA